MNHAQPWAEQRLQTLRGSTGQRVHPLDLSDDRLAAVREALSDHQRWQAFEGALTQQLLRVYDLQPERVRLDSPTASGYWSVTADGLLQFGHSKDYRPDLPQVQVMLSALAPLGLPVATDIVPGQRADDPLDVPAIVRVRARMGRRGVLYVGDCKMGALQTRGFLQAGGDTYLCPLAEVQLPPEVWAGYLAPVQTGQQPLTRITRMTAAGKRVPIADGDERAEPLTADGAGTAHTGTERRLVVRSRHVARAGETALRTRLAKAQAALAALNERGRGKRRCTARPARQDAVAAILTRSRGQGWLAVHCPERGREYPLRRYGSRPATVRVVHDSGLKAVVNRHAVTTAIGRLGWRV